MSDPHISLEHLTTEGRNPASHGLDGLSTLEIVKLINAEDATVSEAVAREADSIAMVIDVVVERMERGGRLVYQGAGTSGRLGVLDAAECPPTFNTDPRQVVGVIAGGESALRTAVEGAEDNPALGASDMADIDLGARDVLVGIATSGRTPYVIGGLQYARSVGAYTVALTCNENGQIVEYADHSIVPVVGPEVITGSTRMKAGTATKMVLNTITTSAMIQIGKTFGNLMVDLRPTNSKLISRAVRIVSQATGLERDHAVDLLNRCGGDVKLAILSQINGIGADEAHEHLKRHKGRLGSAVRADNAHR